MIASDLDVQPLKVFAEFAALLPTHHLTALLAPLIDAGQAARIATTIDAAARTRRCLDHCGPAGRAACSETGRHTPTTISPRSGPGAV